jgi:ribosomal 50S subunit-associated protein YjgA (DUF615 family)
MNSDNIVREVARFSNGFHQLVEELVNELKAHEELIARLEKRLTELYAQSSQAGVKGYNATDLGNMVSEIQTGGLLDDYVDQRISDHPNTDADAIRELARDEAEEVLRNTSFTVTVD